MFLIDLKTLKTQRLQNPRLETCDFWIKNINPPERLVFLMFLIDLKTLKTLIPQKAFVFNVFNWFKNIKNTEAPESETWDLWFLN